MLYSYLSLHLGQHPTLTFCPTLAFFFRASTEYRQIPPAHGGAEDGVRRLLSVLLPVGVRSTVTRLNDYRGVGTVLVPLPCADSS